MNSTLNAVEPALDPNAEPNRVPARSWAWLRRREMLLLLIFVGVLILNVNLSPYFLGIDNLVNVFQLSIEKAIIALIMTLIIISGEIDLSVAAVMGLSATVFGILYQNNVPLPLAGVVDIGRRAVVRRVQRRVDRIRKFAIPRRDAGRVGRLSRIGFRPFRRSIRDELPGLVHGTRPEYPWFAISADAACVWRPVYRIWDCASFFSVWATGIRGWQQ